MLKGGLRAAFLLWCMSYIMFLKYDTK